MRIEHFQGFAAGVNLIVIGEIGKAPMKQNRSSFQGPRRIPHIADAAQRTEKAAGNRDPSTTKLYDRRAYNPEKAASFFETY